MTKLDSLKKLIFKITGKECDKRTIEEAISFLAKELIGEDPNTQTTADALYYIAKNYNDGGKTEGNYAKIFESVQAMNNDTNKNEGDIAVVYNCATSAVTQNTTFRKFIKPERITLDKHITEYIDETIGEEFTHNFYEDILLSSQNEEHTFGMDYLYVSGGYRYDSETEEYTDEFIYTFGLYGYFTNKSYEGHPMYSINFISNDGINFEPSFYLLVCDTESSSDIRVDADNIISEVDIKFSEIEGTWNDIISKFLFTESTNFGGIYQVNNNTYESKVNGDM